MPEQTQVNRSSGESLFNIFGPLVEFLVTPAQTSESFALMKSILPPDMAIPLHSHEDPEVLFVLQGEMEVLKHGADSSSWLTAKPGETICIPGDVKHALRNGSPAPVTVLVATTPNVYGFFRELGRPFRPDEPAGPPTLQDMKRLRKLAAKYNYWMASPEENAAIGLTGF